MPQTWCNGIIKPIFKSGAESDLSNYHGICIFSCLGKLLCSVLNQRRLDHVIESLDILHKSQIGFLADNRTADHVLTLRNLIDEYVHGHQSLCMLCWLQKSLRFDITCAWWTSVQAITTKCGRKIFGTLTPTVASNPRAAHQVGGGLFGCPYINF